MVDAADRQSEFASIGAGHAADALSRLFECTVLMEPPRCSRVEVGQLPESMIYQDEWTAAVFCSLNGAVTGLAGVMFSEGVVNEVVERLVGEDASKGITERGQSALKELGNILISAAAGALGDIQGGIVLPSVPHLGFEISDALTLRDLNNARDRGQAYLAETQLAERQGDLRIRFVWVPWE